MGNLCSVTIPTDDTFARCWSCTSRLVTYIVRLKENLATLKCAQDELSELRKDVIRRVEVEEQLQLKRLEQVGGWLSRAQTLISEVDSVIRDASEVVEKLCFGGCCFRNPVTGYKLGKLVEKKLQEVADLKSKGQFVVVAERVPFSVEVVEERPNEVAVDVGKSVDIIWNYISKEGVGTIGICGMGGVGKTTLLTRLNNSTAKVLLYGFQAVIWVTVSRDMDIEMIQDGIGKRIGLLDGSWKSKQVDEKAVDIYKVLSRKKFMLLLDDVWKRVDLQRIGVPVPGTTNGSKVVFTTRSEEICGHMEAHMTYKVECLEWNSAWELFQKKVGGVALKAHPDIPSLARSVVERCHGLPLAIITVARAMACKKTPQEWHYAVGVLSNCAFGFSGMNDEVLPLLKFSYDSLSSDRVRSCFLYCTLFLGRIYKPNLIDYWIGEGFLDRENDVGEAQNEGYNIIGTLVHACLLEDRGKWVVMHDVIRDMAIWIACDYGQNLSFLSKARTRLNEAPEIQKWVGVKRISLMANDIGTLVEAPSCPSLLTLILSRNCLRMISNDFFQFMANLVVLDLSYNKSLTELPIGVSKLASLQYLNLEMTGIIKLPIELKSLVQMRCLNLSTSALIYIPRQVISSFSMLQVLRMVGCGSQISGAEDDNLLSRSEYLIEELLSLKQLDLLCITLRSADAFYSLLSSRRICICTQELSLQLSDDSKLLSIFSLERMKHLDALRMSNCLNLEVLKTCLLEREGNNVKGCKKFWNFKTTARCFNSLRKVYIDNCPELRDLTFVILAPNLAVLSVSLCNKMEHIICAEKLNPEVETDVVPFRRLEVLYLSHLIQLRSICNTACTIMVPSFLRISVHNCPILSLSSLKYSDTAKHAHATEGFKFKYDGRNPWDKYFASTPAMQILPVKENVH